MTIRRQYSLPNCTLILEGLSNETAVSDPTDKRPLLSVLLHAECKFVGQDTLLSGGSLFFEHLVKAVSAYAQECLSGLRHPQDSEKGTDPVHLEKIADTNLHRLTWQSAGESEENKVTLDLTTVQFFDLMEAIDQFFADSRTLPDLSLQLKPVSRRYRQMEESLAKQTIPAALGITSVALAAIAFFFIEPPSVKKPDPNPQISPTPTQTTPNSSSTPSQ